MNMTLDEKIQSASFFAILIGFALILYEFQQNRSMTAAMLASDGAIHRAELALQFAEFSDVYAKACSNVDALSLSDSFTLSQMYNAFYESRINRVRNYEEALSTGVNRDPGIQRFFRFMFETEFGRKHWSRLRSSFELNLRIEGDDILASMGAPYCFAAGGIDSK